VFLTSQESVHHGRPIVEGDDGIADVQGAIPRLSSQMFYNCVDPNQIPLRTDDEL
jgi:hypothetical protein